MIHVTKAGLYRAVARLRYELGLEDNEYQLDIIALCRRRGIDIGVLPFYTEGLRGMAIVGDADTPDTIILNSTRNKIEQNIDCAHELFHLAYHRDGPQRTFNCFDVTQPKQDKYLEWQANEGGAELVVPFQDLLMQVKYQYHSLNSYGKIMAFKEDMADRYAVTEAVITYRLESLKFEILQYVSGIPMEQIRILSHASQQRNGINIKSLNDVASESMNTEIMKSIMEVSYEFY